MTGGLAYFYMDGETGDEVSTNLPQVEDEHGQRLCTTRVLQGYVHSYTKTNYFRSFRLRK